jgi:hypothetical protein
MDLLFSVTRLIRLLTDKIDSLAIPPKDKKKNRLQYHNRPKVFNKKTGVLIKPR